jgi:hypothetical protein
MRVAGSRHLALNQSCRDKGPLTLETYKKYPPLQRSESYNLIQVYLERGRPPFVGGKKTGLFSRRKFDVSGSLGRAADKRKSLRPARERR